MFQVAGSNALETNDPFLVDNEVGPLDNAARFVEYAKGFHNLLILITEKGIIQLQKFREGLLRKGRIHAYAQDLGILCLKLGVIVRTGRLNMLDSGGAVVSEVKINQHISPTKTAQLEFSSPRARKFEVRRLISDLDREKRSW